ARPTTRSPDGSSATSRTPWATRSRSRACGPWPSAMAATPATRTPFTSPRGSTAPGPTPSVPRTGCSAPSARFSPRVPTTRQGGGGVRFRRRPLPPPYNGAADRLTGRLSAGVRVVREGREGRGGGRFVQDCPVGPGSPGSQLASPVSSTPTPPPLPAARRGTPRTEAAPADAQVERRPSLLRHAVHPGPEPRRRLAGADTPALRRARLALGRSPCPDRTHGRRPPALPARPTSQP